MRSFDSTSGEQTWITPKWIVESLGRFDLDPCAADVMPYATADRMVTKEENGLSVDWGGMIGYGLILRMEGICRRFSRRCTMG